MPSSTRNDRVTRHFIELSDLGAHGLINVLDAADRWQATRGHAFLKGQTTIRRDAIIAEQTN